MSRSIGKIELKLNNSIATPPNLPLVTVGIPVFNGANHLQGMIDCVLRQSYPNIEIIVSDNASTDSTSTILLRLMSDRPATVVHTQPYNVGIVENFRTVLRLAKGEYFIWCAADDTMHERFIEVLVNDLIAHPMATVSMTQTIRINEATGDTNRVRYTSNANPNLLNALQQARLALSENPELRRLHYNMFIAGLFRRRFLNSLFAAIPDISSFGERPIVGIAALSGGLSYVDEPYFTKRLNAVQFAERNKNDPYIENHPKSFFRRLALLMKWLIQTPTIPVQRKIAAIPYFLVTLSGQRFRRAAYRFYSKTMRSRATG